MIGKKTNLDNVDRIVNQIYYDHSPHKNSEIKQVR